MAEANSEEDQSSQPDGSDGGFVSLEQAVDIALGNAKENLAFYGGSWNMQLAWSVVSTEEKEDEYHIRFSYQPAGKFSGTPGLEDFNISKTGEVLLRNILSEPIYKRVGIFGCSLVSALGLLLVVAAMAATVGAVS